MEQLTLESLYGEIKVYSKYGEEFIPKRSTRASAGLDLIAPEDIYLPHGCRNVIDTGLVIDASGLKIPCMMLILPRSSTGSFDELELTNTAAVIDKDYNGKEDFIYVFISRKHKSRVVASEAAKKMYKFKEFLTRLFNQDIGSAIEKGFLPKGYDPASKINSKFQNDREFDSDIKTKMENNYIRKGQAFAQLIFVPVVLPDIVPINFENLTDKSRGGLGSTGK